MGHAYLMIGDLYDQPSCVNEEVETSLVEELLRISVREVGEETERIRIDYYSQEWLVVNEDGIIALVMHFV